MANRLIGKTWASTAYRMLKFSNHKMNQGGPTSYVHDRGSPP